MLVALVQSSFAGGGAGSITHMSKDHFDEVVVTAVVVDITLTKYTFPVVNALEGVRLSDVTLVPFVHSLQVEFSVATEIVLIIPELVEFVLKICKPGVSSILEPPVEDILLTVTVGKVDCATK